MIAACLISACQSTDWSQDNGRTHFQPLWPRYSQSRASIQQRAWRTLLEVLIQDILQSSGINQEDSESETDQDAEEESDQLSSVARYVGIGYNLLKGSPNGDFDNGGGIDPGIYSTREIFELTYNDGKEAYFVDATVKVPDQVSFQPTRSCTQVNKSSVYSGAKSYQKELNIGIDAGGICICLIILR